MTVAAQDVNSGADVDGVLNVQLTDNQGTALSGAVAVTDANGQVHEDHVRDGGGWIVFTDLPYGAVTVVNTQTADGYYQAPAQEAVIIENGVPTVVMVSEPVVTMAMQAEDEGSNSESLNEPTVEPTEVPTEEPTVAPTEVPTEEPTTPPTEEATDVPTEEPTTPPTEEATDVPTEAPTEESTEEASSTPEDARKLKSQSEVQPFALGNPSTQCDPQGNNNGAVITLFVPYDEEPETKPDVSYVQVDRFGNTLDPVSVGPGELVWTGSEYEFSYTTDGTIATVNFDINDESKSVSIGAGCANFNPLQLNIETVAVQEDGTIIPNGGQVGSGVSFGDTAEFVGTGDAIDYVDELAGETVTYTLYDTEGDVVYTDNVIVDSEGNIPASGFYTPTEDGVYDWQVSFAGNDNFAPAESEMGSETVSRRR